MSALEWCIVRDVAKFRAGREDDAIRDLKTAIGRFQVPTTKVQGGLWKLAQEILIHGSDLATEPADKTEMKDDKKPQDAKKTKGNKDEKKTKDKKDKKESKEKGKKEKSKK